MANMHITKTFTQPSRSTQHTKGLGIIIYRNTLPKENNNNVVINPPRGRRKKEKNRPLYSA
jgi:hypothetical protein